MPYFPCSKTAIQFPRQSLAWVRMYPPVYAERTFKASPKCADSLLSYQWVIKSFFHFALGNFSPFFTQIKDSFNYCSKNVKQYIPANPILHFKLGDLHHTGQTYELVFYYCLSLPLWYSWIWHIFLSGSLFFHHSFPVWTYFQEIYFLSIWDFLSVSFK